MRAKMHCLDLGTSRNDIEPIVRTQAVADPTLHVIRLFQVSGRIIKHGKDLSDDAVSACNDAHILAHQSHHANIQSRDLREIDPSSRDLKPLSSEFAR